MHLLLIRHGETDWNIDGRLQGHTDIALNATGITQAENLATRMALEEKIDALYTSPLARARVTAEIVARHTRTTAQCDDRLKEKRLGDLEGLTRADFQQRYPELYTAWHTSQVHYPLPGEETPIELQTRIQTFLADVRAQNAHANRIVIVSHGGTIGMMLATLIGLDIDRRSPFWFDNASVSRVDLSNARPRIRFLNDTCHLRNGSSNEQ